MMLKVLSPVPGALGIPCCRLQGREAEALPVASVLERWWQDLALGPGEAVPVRTHPGRCVSSVLLPVPRP